MAARRPAWAALLLLGLLSTVAFAAETELTPPQRDWLAQHAIPFKTAEPASSDEDLQPLHKLVGKARVIAIGECTHGTSEFFLIKHRLTKFLAAESGFTIFALETGMVEARQVDDYIRTGQGDPKQLLIEMGYWDWSTQEFLDLVHWMRKCARAGKPRVQFAGFDMQTPTLALENVRAFIHREAPAYEGEFRKAFAPVYRSRGPAWLAFKNASAKDLATLVTGSRAVLKHLESGRERYGKQRALDEVDWAIQNARLLFQHADYLRQGMASTYRDRCMAENAFWLLEHAPPGSRMIISAHNDHIARSTGAMGDHLSKRLGADLLVLGCIFHQGRYNAYPLFDNSAEAQAQRATTPPKGSVERRFHETGAARLIVDLRKAKKTPTMAWLTEPLLFRSIGWKVQFVDFSRRAVSDEFDGLIFFDRTNPSKLLR